MLDSSAKSFVFIQYLNYVLSIVSALLFSRLLLSSIGEELFGVYISIFTFSSVLFTTFSGSLNYSVSRYILSFKGKSLGIEEVIASGIAITVTITLMSTVLFVCTFPYFMNQITLEYNSTVLAIGLFVYFFCYAISIPMESLFHSDERGDILLYINLLDSISKLSYILILMYLDCLNLFNLGCYFGIIGPLKLIILSTLVLKKRKLKFSRNSTISIAKFAGYNWLSDISYSALNLAQNLIISRSFGVKQVSSYGIAQQLSSNFSGFLSSGVKSLLPYTFRTYNQNEIRNRLIIWFSRLSLLAYIVLDYFLAEILDLWLEDVPNNALKISRYLLGFIVLESSNITLSNYLFVSGEIKLYKILPNLIFMIWVLLIFLIAMDLETIYDSFISTAFLVSMSRLFIASKVLSLPIRIIMELISINLFVLIMLL